MSRLSAPAVLASCAILAWAPACGDSNAPVTDPPTQVATQQDAPRGATGPEGASQPAAHSHCPTDAGNCATASGSIIYTQSHDPDGDGDAHFVLLSEDSITAPGISVIDVNVDLRPHPLPPLGAEISAAGPVYPGSYGQHQIQAFELHVGGPG